MQLPVIGGAVVQRDTFDVLVGSMRVVVSWVPKPTRPARTLCIDLVLPPAALVSNKAENIYAAMFKHPALRAFHDLVKSLRERAALEVNIHEGDGALGNDRYHYGVIKDVVDVLVDLISF